MTDQIYFREDTGRLQINSKVYAQYIVKCPSVKNRLSKSGSAGLKMDEVYDLKHGKKRGVVYIDMTKKAFVVVPVEVFLSREPVSKECNGVKNSIFSFDMNRLIETYNLQVVPIGKKLKEESL